MTGESIPKRVYTEAFYQKVSYKNTLLMQITHAVTIEMKIQIPFPSRFSLFFLGTKGIHIAVYLTFLMKTLELLFVSTVLKA